MSNGQAFSVGIAIIFSGVVGAIIWEAIQSVMHEHNQRLREVRELRRLNAQLRDELQRLRQR
jgi:hypothetical protein